MSDPSFTPLSPIVAGLRQCCPRCGQGKLFRGFLTVAPSCDRCGLDYSFADPADGPAFFVMSGVGVVVIAVFAWTYIALRPPVWLQLAVVLPSLVVACLAALRPVKAWLVASQFYHKAEQGQILSPGRHDFDDRRM